jgi:hypothetical protein
MNFFKLGCYWGKGKPNYYPMLLKKDILLGVKGKRYSIGDLVLIADGFKAKAIFKVLSQPVTVTTISELKDDFSKYQIPYTEEIEVYRGKFFIIKPEDSFQYRVQRGIVKVHKSDIKEKIYNIVK